ncbi:MAG: 5-formyltetrahydrofolate cyclo-ligase [Chloroflexi bacterium OHK40]
MDDTATSDRKWSLRRELRARRDALAERAALSATICARLLALPAIASATAIHTYLPIRSEVDTRPLVRAALDSGKGVAIPIVAASGQLMHSWIDGLEPEQFEPGALGTLRPRTVRPASPGTWAVTIVPLLGFDRDCYRLGYGKGYYDQLLAALPGCVAIGVAFAAQEVEQVPREPHDHPLDMVVTEADVYTRLASPGPTARR